MNMISTMKRLRVKLIARGSSSQLWKKQLSGNRNYWHNCEFVFDLESNAYDWLVVIDDVSRKINGQIVKLCCPEEHTLLVTTEPPTITRYGHHFTSQFANVLTTQPESSLQHPKRIFSNSAHFWFNGHSFDELCDNKNFVKNKILSSVCSSKLGRITNHSRRFEFTQYAQKRIGELDVYGHGVKFISKKFQALDSYKFHLAIENYIGDHHWTEKISDAFLSECIPIYYGCPNIDAYFPIESIIQIDLKDFNGSVRRIQDVIQDPRYYQDRYDAIKEAKRKVMEKYNLLALLDGMIPELDTSSSNVSGKILHGRKKMRLIHPREAIEHITWKTKCFYHEHMAN